MDLFNFFRAQAMGKIKGMPKTRRGAKHKHGAGKGRKNRRYVVGGLRP